MEAMLEELEGDTLIDKQITEIFLQNLLKELNIPISKKQLGTEIKACFGTKDKISKEQLRSIIFNKLPLGRFLVNYYLFSKNSGDFLSNLLTSPNPSMFNYKILI